ncbi:PAS domain-containing sensor histidine kinase [Brevibacillus sp. H7]|uniref:PAS domain-containing sensor histidine kinase n=1 Tax=Brevibacillus sp. H7 TaxID=3349138 RepID=UPI003815B5A9
MKSANGSRTGNGLYFSVFQQSPDPMFVLSSQLLIIEANMQAEQFAHVALKEMIGEPITRFFPQDAAVIEDRLHQVHQQKKETQLSLYRERDGVRTAVDCMFFPLIGPDEEAAGVIASFRPRVVESATEITERKHMEKELFEAESLYRSLVENTLVGVYIAYVEEKGFVYVNPRMEEMFGYTQAELVKMSAADLVVPEEREIVRLNQRRREQGDRSSVVYKFRGLHKNGNVISLEVIQKTTLYKGKRAVIGMLLDNTERRQAEEMVRKSELLSVVGQLAAGVAHEIRNPLTSLKGFVQLLQSHVQDKQDYLSIMLSELNRIEYIISEFLVLAKPQNVVYKERDVRPLLEHIIALAETHAIMHNVQIAAVYEKELPLVKCEENQLKQVFLNLLKNAVEAMSGGGEVRVEVRWEQQKNLLIRFVDQGCGIAEERIPKLGEPFYTTKEKGTGLGLMVSYKIIENHGGTINVISRERKGTTFEIRLPACNP